VQAPVLAVLDEMPDIRTFRVMRPEGFEFQAGQFVAIRIKVAGGDQVRCYSISSSPEASGYLEISVKRQGLVSSTLHATVRPGSMLWMRAPGGAFTYPTDEDRPLLLIAGGVGITPLVSMVRHGLAADPGRPMVLLYAARTEQDFAFQDELRLLARRHPALRLCFAATRSAERADVYRGRIDAALITTAMPDVQHAVALMCGPQQMLDELRQMLSELGVATEQQRYELFEAAVAAASRLSAPPEPAATRADTVEVHACKSNRRAVARPGQSLLDAVEAHGIEIPSLCRAGVCGTCRTKVVSGDVHCTANMLDDEDRAGGIVLACVASAVTDCVIEA
jgi:ferredoxin-NADP reductase